MILLVTPGSATALQAQPTAQGREVPERELGGGARWWQEEGDGRRRSGPGSALTIAAAYLGDAFYNAAGGVREGGVLLHNLDVTIELDGEQAFGVAGLEAFAYLLANAGGSLSEYAGDRQVASNIEAPSAVRVYELWVQKGWGDRWSLLVGLYDLNSEFYASGVASLFINSAHGIGPEFAESGVNGPSIFPVTSLAARLEWTPDSTTYARLAVLDAVPGDPEDEARLVHIELGGEEGALIAAETGIVDDAAIRGLAVGGWWYTARFVDPVDPEVTRRGTYGAYVLGEAQLLPVGDRTERGLAAFARLGYADSSVHPMAWGWGGGLTYTGVGGREEDEIGLAVAAGVQSSRYLRARRLAGSPVHRSETAFELTYSFQVASWLRLQPDIQYILHPGMTSGRQNALLLGTRIEIGW